MTTRETPAAAAPSVLQAGYVIVVLMLAYTLSFVDRQVLSLLVDPIRQDLGVSDIEMGLLQGLAFAVLYTLLGLPIGRLADSGNRKLIIVTGVAVWSAMTIACGLARSYAMLALARVGVGVGEAALSPAAFSIIGDYVPRNRLNAALSVYSMGVFLGSGLAFIIGSLVLGAVANSDLSALAAWGFDEPWRVVFLIAGAPGILMVALLLSIREPVRLGAIAQDQARISDVLDYVRRHWGAFAVIFLGFALHACMFYGIMSWLPAGLMRKFNTTPDAIGIAMGVGVAVMGCLGLLVGGALGDYWFSRRRTTAAFRVALISCAGVVAFIGAASVVNDATWALLLGVGAFFWVAMPVGAAPAALQLILPNNYRATVSAMYLFTISIVSLGLGPLLPPLLNAALAWPSEQILTALGITTAVLCAGSAAVFLIGKSAYARCANEFVQ